MMGKMIVPMSRISQRIHLSTSASFVYSKESPSIVPISIEELPHQILDD